MSSLASPTEVIVDAEIVRPVSPLRFGLRGLMVVTALCSVQFAVMNYLGVLIGFAVGGAVCLGAMIAVMVASLFIGRSDRELFSQLDRLAIRLVLALTAIGISGAFSGGGILILQQIAPLRLAWKLERQLGMKTKREFARQNGEFVEVLRITTIAPGQLADQAGLKIDDRILPLPNINEFYKNLDDHRGQEVDVTVYRGGSALNQLDNLTELDISLPIPSN